MSSLLWAITPVVAAGGALIVLAQMRKMAEVVVDLEAEMGRLGEVRRAVAEVRAAADDARATARRLRRA